MVSVDVKSGWKVEVIASLDVGAPLQGSRKFSLPWRQGPTLNFLKSTLPLETLPPICFLDFEESTTYSTLGSRAQ